MCVRVPFVSDQTVPMAGPKKKQFPITRENKETKTGAFPQQSRDSDAPLTNRRLICKKGKFQQPKAVVHFYFEEEVVGDLCLCHKFV